MTFHQVNSFIHYMSYFVLLFITVYFILFYFVYFSVYCTLCMFVFYNHCSLVRVNKWMDGWIVCNAGRHSPSSDLLHSRHWLPVRHRIEFKTATLCFIAVKLGTPSYLNNMLKPYAPLRALRSSNMDLLTIPRTDTSLGLRRFSVAGPQVWNRLPHELRQCNTISSFKSNLKTHYFRRHMDS